MSQVKNETVLKNVIWRYCERFLAQVITFIVSLVLARIISPGAYGSVVIVTAVVNMLEVFSTRGFNLALIQKKEVHSIDYSSVFYTNFVIECVLYVIIFFASPYIAIFYNDANLTALIRVLSFKLIINGFNTVQQAYVQRNMLYRRFFFATLIGTITSGIVGVILALMGAGAWALVVQILVNVCMDTIILFLTIEWKPRIEFSIICVREMFPYGISMLGQGILEAIYSQIRTLGIGKVYSTSELAYYDKGQHIPTLVLSNVQTAASNVFFSALSREDSDVAVKEKMRQYLGAMFYIITPMMIGLAIVGKSVLLIFYTEKWVGAYPYLVIYSFYYLTWIVQIPIAQAINSRGMAKLSFEITLIHRINSIVLMFVFLKKGTIMVALSALIADVTITIFLLGYAKYHFKYATIDMIKDLIPTVLYSIIMGASIYGIGLLIDNIVLRLIAQIVCGAFIYFLLSVLFKDVWFLRIIQLMKKTTSGISRRNN